MPRMITSAELDLIREAVEDTFADTCTIQSVTRASDGTGGFTESWSSRANVPCRLVTASIGNRSGLTQAGQWHVASAWTLQLPWDEAIATGNRVVLDGQTYQVLSVDDAHSQRAYRRAYLKRVD